MAAPLLIFCEVILWTGFLTRFSAPPGPGGGLAPVEAGGLRRLAHLPLACASVCMGLLLLVFAYGQYSWGAFLEYFTSPALMALNILPVAFLIFLFYGLTGRAWLAFLLGGGAALGFSLGNYYKLSFRDDPLYMEDIFLNLREAAAMATGQHYDLFMDKRVATALICWLGGTLVLFFLVRGRLRGWKGRGTALVVTVAAGAALTPLYLDEDTYDSVGSYEILNQWSATQNYIAHGFFYPFLHSVTEFVESARRLQRRGGGGAPVPVPGRRHPRGQKGQRHLHHAGGLRGLLPV